MKIIFQKIKKDINVLLRKSKFLQTKQGSIVSFDLQFLTVEVSTLEVIKFYLF